MSGFLKKMLGGFTLKPLEHNTVNGGLPEGESLSRQKIKRLDTFWIQTLFAEVFGIFCEVLAALFPDYRKRFVQRGARNLDGSLQWVI